MNGKKSNMSSKLIVGVALLPENTMGFFSLPKPHRHHELFTAYPNCCKVKHTQGFILNTGEFIDRSNGYRLALQNGQYKFHTSNIEGQLFSEDLW